MIEKTTKIAIPKKRIWFNIREIEINKPSKQIKISNKLLKILNRYDFFSSVVFCFNDLTIFLEIKNITNKLATSKTMKE